MSHPPYNPYASGNQNPTQGQYGLPNLQTERDPRRGSSFYGHGSNPSSSGPLFGISENSGGMMSSSLNYLSDASRMTSDEDAKRSIDMHISKAREEARLPVSRMHQHREQGSPFTGGQRDEFCSSGTRLVSYPLASASSSRDTHQAVIQSGDTNFSWLTNCARSSSDGSVLKSSPALSNFARGDGGQFDTSSEGQNKTQAIPGLGDYDSDKSQTSRESKYTSESAASILQRFGLEKGDLEHLISYPEDQITPANLPFILRKIRLEKDKKMTAGLQPTQTVSGLDRYSLSRATEMRIEETSSSVLQPSKVIDYGHTGKYTAGGGDDMGRKCDKDNNGGSNNVFMMDTAANRLNLEPQHKNTTDMKSSALGSSCEQGSSFLGSLYSSVPSSAAPSGSDQTKRLLTQPGLTYQNIPSSFSFPQKDTAMRGLTSEAPKPVPVKQPEGDRQAVKASAPSTSHGRHPSRPGLVLIESTEPSEAKDSSKTKGKMPVFIEDVKQQGKQKEQTKQHPLKQQQKTPAKPAQEQQTKQSQKKPVSQTRKALPPTFGKSAPSTGVISNQNKSLPSKKHKDKLATPKDQPSPVMMFDYSATPPRIYPHTCSLCNKECTNMQDWISHQNSSLHLESCTRLRKQYPNWDGEIVLEPRASGKDAKPPPSTSAKKPRRGSHSRSKSPSPHHRTGSAGRKDKRRSRSRSPQSSRYGYRFRNESSGSHRSQSPEKRTSPKRKDDRQSSPRRTRDRRSPVRRSPPRRADNRWSPPRRSTDTRSPPRRGDERWSPRTFDDRQSPLRRSGNKWPPSRRSDNSRSPQRRSQERRSSREGSSPQRKVLNPAESLAKKLMKTSAVQSLSHPSDLEAVVKTLAPALLAELAKMTSSSSSPSSSAKRKKMSSASSSSSLSSAKRARSLGKLPSRPKLNERAAAESKAKTPLKKRPTSSAQTTTTRKALPSTRGLPPGKSTGSHAKTPLKSASPLDRPVCPPQSATISKVKLINQKAPAKDSAKGSAKGVSGVNKAKVLVSKAKSISTKKISKKSTASTAKAAKTAPKAKQEAPKAKQEAPKAKQEPSKEKQEAPKAKQEAPKAKQEAPKAKQEAPKAKQEAPKAKQEAPKAKQEAPKAKQEALKEKQEPSKEKQEPSKEKQEPSKEKQEASKEKQEAPKAKQEAPKEKQEAPKAKQEAPKANQEAPKAKQEPSKEKQEPSKEKQEAPKEKQEASKEKQEASKEKQEAPKENQEAPKEKQEAPKEKQEAPKETQEGKPEPLKSDPRSYPVSVKVVEPAEMEDTNQTKDQPMEEKVVAAQKPEASAETVRTEKDKDSTALPFKSDAPSTEDKLPPEQSNEGSVLVLKGTVEDDLVGDRTVTDPEKDQSNEKTVVVSQVETILTPLKPLIDKPEETAIKDTIIPLRPPYAESSKRNQSHPKPQGSSEAQTDAAESGKASPPTMVKLHGICSSLSHSGVVSAVERFGKTKSVVLFRARLEAVVIFEKVEDAKKLKTVKSLDVNGTEITVVGEKEAVSKDQKTPFLKKPASSAPSSRPTGVTAAAKGKVLVPVAKGVSTPLVTKTETLASEICAKTVEVKQDTSSDSQSPESQPDSGESKQTAVEESSVGLTDKPEASEQVKGVVITAETGSVTEKVTVPAETETKVSASGLQSDVETSKESDKVDADEPMELEVTEIKAAEPEEAGINEQNQPPTTSNETQQKQTPVVQQDPLSEPQGQEAGTGTEQLAAGSTNEAAVDSTSAKDASTSAAVSEPKPATSRQPSTGPTIGEMLDKHLTPQCIYCWPFAKFPPKRVPKGFRQVLISGLPLYHEGFYTEGDIHNVLFPFGLQDKHSIYVVPQSRLAMAVMRSTASVLYLLRESYINGVYFRGIRLLVEVINSRQPLTPAEFYKFVKKVLKQKWTATEPQRTIFIRNIKWSEIKELRGALKEFAPVANFMPILNKLFIEFETIPDATAFKNWYDVRFPSLCHNVWMRREVLRLGRLTGKDAPKPPDKASAKSCPTKEATATASQKPETASQKPETSENQPGPKPIPDKSETTDTKPATEALSNEVMGKEASENQPGSKPEPDGSKTEDTKPAAEVLPNEATEASEIPPESQPDKSETVDPIPATEAPSNEATETSENQIQSKLDKSETTGTKPSTESPSNEATEKEASKASENQPPSGSSEETPENSCKEKPVDDNKTACGSLQSQVLAPEVKSVPTLQEPQMEISKSLKPDQGSFQLSQTDTNVCGSLEQNAGTVRSNDEANLDKAEDPGEPMELRGRGAEANAASSAASEKMEPADTRVSSSPVVQRTVGEMLEMRQGQVFTGSVEENAGTVGSKDEGKLAKDPGELMELMEQQVEAKASASAASKKMEPADTRVSSSPVVERTVGEMLEMHQGQVLPQSVEENAGTVGSKDEGKLAKDPGEPIELMEQQVEAKASASAASEKIEPADTKASSSSVVQPTVGEVLETCQGQVLPQSVEENAGTVGSKDEGKLDKAENSGELIEQRVEATASASAASEQKKPAATRRSAFIHPTIGEMLATRLSPLNIYRKPSWSLSPTTKLQELLISGLPPYHEGLYTEDDVANLLAPYGFQNGTEALFVIPQSCLAFAVMPSGERLCEIIREAERNGIYLQNHQLVMEAVNVNYPLNAHKFYRFVKRQLRCLQSTQDEAQRTVHITNISHSETTKLREALRDFAPVTNFMPLLNKLFVEFGTVTDADQFEGWYRQLSPAPRGQVFRLEVPGPLTKLVPTNTPKSAQDSCLTRGEELEKFLTRKKIGCFKVGARNSPKMIITWLQGKHCPSEEEMVDLLTPFGYQHKGHNIYIFPQACVALVQMQTVSDVTYAIRASRKKPLKIKDTVLSFFALRGSISLRPFWLYQTLMQMSDPTLANDRDQVIFIRDISASELKDLREVLQKQDSIRNILPLLNKVFIEFKSSQDADWLGVWYSLLKKPPDHRIQRLKIPNSYRSAPEPKIPKHPSLDRDDVFEGATLPTGRGGIPHGSASPFWLSLRNSPFVFPTVSPWFIIPEYVTVRDMYAIELASRHGVMCPTVMFTGLPEGDYKHEDVARLVWPFFPKQNLWSLFYNVTVLPLQRRAFVFFADWTTCCKFLKSHIDKPISLRGHTLSVHVVTQNLYPESCEEKMYKSLMKLTNVGNLDASPLEERLLCVGISEVSLDVITLVVEMVASITTFVNFLPLANRICIEMSDPSGVAQVVEKSNDLSPNSFTEDPAWSRVQHFETLKSLRKRLEDAADVTINLEDDSFGERSAGIDRTSLKSIKVTVGQHRLVEKSQSPNPERTPGNDFTDDIIPSEAYLFDELQFNEEDFVTVDEVYDDPDGNPEPHGSSSTRRESTGERSMKKDYKSSSRSTKDVRSSSSSSSKPTKSTTKHSSSSSAGKAASSSPLKSTETPSSPSKSDTKHSGKTSSSSSPGTPSSEKAKMKSAAAAQAAAELLSEGAVPPSDHRVSAESSAPETVESETKMEARGEMHPPQQRQGSDLNQTQAEEMDVKEEDNRKQKKDEEDDKKTEEDTTLDLPEDGTREDGGPGSQPTGSDAGLEVKPEEFVEMEVLDSVTEDQEDSLALKQPPEEADDPKTEKSEETNTEECEGKNTKLEEMEVKDTETGQDQLLQEEGSKDDRKDLDDDVMDQAFEILDAIDDQNETDGSLKPKLEEGEEDDMYEVIDSVEDQLTTSELETEKRPQRSRRRGATPKGDDRPSRKSDPTSKAPKSAAKPKQTEAAATMAFEILDSVEEDAAARERSGRRRSTRGKKEPEKPEEVTYEVLDSVEAAKDEPTVMTRSTRGRRGRASEDTKTEETPTRRRQAPARESRSKEKTPAPVPTKTDAEPAAFEILDSVECVQEDPPPTSGRGRRGRPRKQTKTTKNATAKVEKEADEEEEEAAYQILDSVEDEVGDNQPPVDQTESERKENVSENSEEEQKSVPLAEEAEEETVFQVLDCLDEVQEDQATAEDGKQKPEAEEDKQSGFNAVSEASGQSERLPLPQKDEEHDDPSPPEGSASGMTEETSPTRVSQSVTVTLQRDEPPGTQSPLVNLEKVSDEEEDYPDDTAEEEELRKRQAAAKQKQLTKTQRARGTRAREERGKTRGRVEVDSQELVTLDEVGADEAEEETPPQALVTLDEFVEEEEEGQSGVKSGALSQEDESVENLNHEVKIQTRPLRVLRTKNPDS